MRLEIIKHPNNPSVEYISFEGTQIGRSIVRDFTIDVPDSYEYTTSIETEYTKRVMNPQRMANFKYNLKRLPKSLELRTLVDRHDGEVLYICGNGYSAKEHAHLLSGVSGKILALNGAIDIVPRADYFMAMEWTANMGLKADHYDVPAILSISANRHIVQRFSEVYYFQDNRHESLEAKIRAKVPFLAGLDTNLEVGFSALHLAWLMGFKTIVTIGMEHCYSDPTKLHATEDFTQAKQSYAVELSDGRRVLSDVHMMLGVQFIKCALFFLRRRGVRVIECSHGLIEEECELMDLADAIADVESGMTTGSGEIKALELAKSSGIENSQKHLTHV